MKNVERFLVSRPYRHASPDDSGGAGGDAGGDTAGGDSDAGAVDGGGDSGAAGAGAGAAGDDTAGAGGGTGGSDLDADGGDGGAGGGDKQVDWRAAIAGDDPNKLARLQRYTTIDDWNDSAFQAHEKLRKGEISTGLPENPSDEQLREYREANNVPLDGNYFDNIHLEEGLQLTETDREMFEPVYAIAHELNIPQEGMSAMTNALLIARENVFESMRTQDGVDTQNFTAMAKENWGGDYDTNMARADNLLNRLPEAVREELKAGRLADGKAITSSLEVMNWLVGIDRELNPLGGMPADGGNVYQTALDIIKESEERMKNDRANWYKDTEAQKRYMAALEQRDKFDKKQ